jgi:SAM-dependent methyltransferase
MNKKEHWEDIYQSKSAVEVSWYQQQPTLSLRLIHQFAPQHTDHIIDVGGGASTLCDHLLQDGYQHITVLDLSANALRQAQQRLGEKAECIHWQEEDITQFAPDGQYDLWHDRAVFHFLTAANDRQRYRQVLETAVRNGGYVIIAAFAIGGPTQCSGLDIVQYDAGKLKTTLGEKFTLVAEQTENHLTPSGKQQAFGYFVFHKKVN